MHILELHAVYKGRVWCQLRCNRGRVCHQVVLICSCTSLICTSWALTIWLDSCIAFYGVCKYCVVVQSTKALFPSSPTSPPSNVCFSLSVFCTDWAAKPHWWDGGVSAVYWTAPYVRSYSTGSSSLMTSNALTNGWPMNLSLVSLADTNVAP